MQYFYIVTKSGKSYGSFDTLELAQAFAVQMPISTTIWQGNYQVAEINH
jgi:hypothetical protein